MTHLALARRYRPRRFGEMAMQEHVAETLRSAVAHGRTAHAYLFCGPRGVGKTTAARVLAMALNCAERGEDGEPCGNCESCERIWSGRTSLDVVEIDAASNRGVDDARDLRERAMYAPTDDRRYKVYIVDEAHMLTREAWNALLKILEEPPPRVIFAFATTEPQKIRQTAPAILSRCQRFDFRRISVAGIVERLRQVLSAENVDAKEDALLPIARRAEGGLRDALSLLDQVLSFADGKLVASDVRRVLGLVDDEVYLELFDILAGRRHADVFRFVQKLLDEGYDLAEFHRGLADALRLLLIIRLENGESGDVSAYTAGADSEIQAAYSERAQRFAHGDLLRMLASVAELDTEGRFRKSANPRIALEALLLRFAHMDRTVELEAMIRAAGAGAGAAGSSQEPHRTGKDSQSTKENARENDLAVAFQTFVHDGEGVPAGLGVFLKAARIIGAEADRVIIEVPPGPGLERLRDQPADRRSLEDGFAKRLGRRAVIEVRPAGGEEGDEGSPERITPDQVKRERLERLTNEEPVLGRAVEEWDLELLD